MNRFFGFFAMGVIALTSCSKADTTAEQPWIVDRFDDIKVIRYEVPGFEDLTLEEKELVYYLSEAAKCGRDIIYDQNFKYNIAIRRTLETIYTASEQREGDDRAYLQGKQDIHEQSMDLQRKVRQVYIDAAEYDDHMHVVDCTDSGEMASPEAIFSRIMKVVEPYVK